MRVRCSYNTIKARSSRSYASNTPSTDILQQQQQHFIFGANTDIGKTVLSAALVRASYEGPKKKSDSKTTNTTTSTTHYIKPLQCGGSDESFIRRYAQGLSSSKTLFDWETPASPHIASRIEDIPVSDEHVLTALNDYLRELKTSSLSSSAAAAAASTMRENSSQSSSVWIETAGGVLSPSSSSPNNNDSHHAKNGSGWGWVTQADLYIPFQNQSSVVLVGDGRLGGISTTIASLEALLIRNYTIAGILFIQDTDDDTTDTNQEALKEYISSYNTTPSNQRKLQQQQNSGGGLLFDNPDDSIISLPRLPPEPEPLNEWFASNDVKEPISSFVHNHLFLYDGQKREQQQ
jgi:dethiobiotin synthetase